MTRYELLKDKFERYSKRLAEQEENDVLSIVARDIKDIIASVENADLRTVKENKNEKDWYC